MAIEAISTNVPLRAGERFAGLNHVSDIYARYFGDSWQDVERFISDISDKRDPLYEENSRALSAIYFLAKIPKEKHEGGITNFSHDEKKALISAMNHFRAVVSLFPRRLTMPV